MLCFTECFSQNGKLDVSFAKDGIAYNNIQNLDGSQLAWASAIQADGKILIAGDIDPNGNSNNSVIYRLNTDGSFDLSFNKTGLVYCFGIAIRSMAIQSDGKIVVGGMCWHRVNGISFGLARYNIDGSLDLHFGSQGKISALIIPSNPNTGYHFFRALAIQTDGKIIAAGNCKDDFGLARFNSDGSLDLSFDGDGKVTTPMGPSLDQLTSLAIQSDGKIICGGYARTTANGKEGFALARYNTNGSLDTSFDGDGKVVKVIGSYSQAYAIAIQNDGKIVMSGLSANTTNQQILTVARFNINGAPDSTFDGDGNVATTGIPISRGIAIQPDGKIIAAGFTLNDFAVVRYESNGSLDSTFDNDGKVTTSMGPGMDPIHTIALQPDGKIVVAGASLAGNDYSSNGAMAAARYKTDGSLDTSFDHNGKLIIIANKKSGDEATSMAIQNDGKIVVAGRTNINGNYDFALARFNTDGRPDSSFSDDGKLITSMGFSTEKINAVVIQKDGKIVVAGFILDGTIGKIALARYNPNGLLDQSFDGDGKLITVIGTQNSVANAITIQSDGKILIAGYTYEGNADRFIIIRYNPDGSLDTSFDGDGKLTTSIGATSIASSMVIQSDGKIVVGGYGYVGSYNAFELARYNIDGSPDLSFSLDGKLSTSFPSGITHAFLTSLVIQKDGKIVAAGYAKNLSDRIFLALARYNADGSIDNSFDGDGMLIDSVKVSKYTNVSVAIQDNGKILIAGTTDNDRDDDLVLIRYNKNGSLDKSLDGDGKAFFDLFTWSSEIACAISLYSNRIYIAGSFYTERAANLGVVAVSNDLMPYPSLLEFSGKLINSDAVLNWKTENELNISEYIVERSIDGTNYTAMDTVAAFNTPGIHNYQFTDRGVITLGTSVIYYRLKVKDMNGEFTYSRIVQLFLDNRNSVLLYPNPVVNAANLSITIDFADKVRCRIIDNLGRIVQQRELNIQAGGISISLDVSKLAKGVYYLQVKGKTIDKKVKFIK